MSRVACLLTVPRSPASPSSPKPKSITMGIDEIKPRQLAPSVGIGDADCAVVTVPTRMIYNSATTESHLLFGAFDFIAHSPDTMKDFEPIGDGLEILFGSFCFQVGQTGTLRLPERCPCHQSGPLRGPHTLCYAHHHKQMSSTTAATANPICAIRHRMKGPTVPDPKAAVAADQSMSATNAPWSSRAT